MRQKTLEIVAELEKLCEKYNFSFFKEFFIDKYYRKALPLEDIAGYLAMDVNLLRDLLRELDLPLRKVDDETPPKLD